MEHQFNFLKLAYYLGGVGTVLLLGVLWYIVRGKKDQEEAIKKKKEEDAAAAIANGQAGHYSLLPGADGENVPNIMIMDPSGECLSKINTITPREIFKNYPKTEEEQVNKRRDYVINMIVSEGASTEDYMLSQ